MLRSGIAKSRKKPVPFHLPECSSVVRGEEEGEGRRSRACLSEAVAAAVVSAEHHQPPPSLASLLRQCAATRSLALGRRLHCLVSASHHRHHHHANNIVVQNLLLHMYGKCGSLRDAHVAFREIPRPDIISWNTLISAHAQNGHEEDALHLFCNMQVQGLKPDKVTMVSVLSACTRLGASTIGRSIHAQIIAIGVESQIIVTNALLNMYGKCGCLMRALEVFNQMPQRDRDAFSWNSLLVAYVKNGHSKEALEAYKRMKAERNILPNMATFVIILNGCSHAGLLREGRRYFISMMEDYGIEPSVDHYACIIDLFGRIGRLNEAELTIIAMPIRPDAVVWKTLMRACQLHGDLDRAARVALNVFKMDPKNPSPYIMLANMYASVGRWEDVAKTRKAMDDKGLKKQPGCSWIEIRGVMHRFIAGRSSHPQSERINAKLTELSRSLKLAGYMPNTTAVFHDVEEEEKENMLFYHSEKQAIAFGLITGTMHETTPLRIFKNLRICPDCHLAAKFISKIVEREIIIRDSQNFHYFKDGICSCGDYW